MWLVLCPSNDQSALWACEGLRARGLEPLELVTAESLDLGVRWEHRVGTEHVSLTATLADGRKIRDNEIRGVLNRLTYLTVDSLPLFRAADREYVKQELQSFFLGWLATMPGPVINEPTPWGLSGRWRHISEWIALAAGSGLPVPSYHMSTRSPQETTGWPMRAFSAGTPLTTLITVRDKTLGAPAPPEITSGCLRLAASAGTTLLGVEFATGPDGEWTFAGATPQPDLRLGGDALLDILASLLTDKHEAKQ